MTPPVLLQQRLAVLACLIVTPLLNFLARNQYSPFRAESLAAIAVLVAVCLLLAALTWRRPAFFALTAVCIGLVCATPLSFALSRWFQLTPWISFLSAASGGGLALFLMRERLFPVLAAVAISTHAALLLEQTVGAKAHRPPAANAPLNHILYLIFDEHLGIAGFPAEIGECASAAQAVSATLAVHGFSVYPNAYSNYPVTIDSLPSILNRTLLAHSRQKIRQSSTGALTYALDSNALARDQRFTRKAIHVTQHSSLELTPNLPDILSPYQDKLGNIQLAEGGWLQKARWIIGSYQASDPVLQKVRAFFPFRLGGHTTGPLSILTVWPGSLTDDILSAQQPTLFLAHLLTPHHPYLMRKDGSVRPFEQWASDRADHRLDETTYRDTYQRYCEQVEYLSTQVDSFMTTLVKAGVWDSITVVIHGDHGSRIRGNFPSGTYNPALEASPERYDYRNGPNRRDLLDRFSTLLAIKLRDQHASRVIPENASLLQFLERDFYQTSAGTLNPATSGAYLFTEFGALHPIAIQKYWR